MKDILNPEEIKESVIKNKIDFWYPFSCSICGREYGYYFNGDKVLFNGACDCSCIFGKRFASYQDIADLYNINKNEKFRQEILNYFKLK